MTRQAGSSIPIQEFPLWKRMAGNRNILSFEIELTARCNCRCRHCYINLSAGDRLARKRELSRAVISRIADEAVSMGALWCLITGGEPLLRKDFSDIYLDLKRKGLLVSVFTNAQLLTHDHAALFSVYPPRDLEITVYGATKVTYERVTRRPGSYAAFRNGLDRLLKAGVRVQLKAMALRSNVAELPEIARFCREYTYGHFRFDPLLHLRFDGDRDRNVEIRAERLSALEIVAVEQADGERSEMLKSKCSELINPEHTVRTCRHLFHCGVGMGNFYLTHDGQFRLCSSLCHPECTYDLKQGSLLEAYRTLVSAVRSMCTSRDEFLQTCHVCPIVALCSWCPAHAHLETGRLDGSVDYFCEVAHARAASLKIIDAAASKPEA